MLLTMDYNFNIKYLLRFVLIHKFGSFTNVLQIPSIRSLLIFFSIVNLEDIDDVSIYNNFFLLRFFFGKKCMFTKYNYFYNLGRYFYSFKMQVFFNNRELFFPLSFLINDLLAFTAESNFTVSHYYNNIFNSFLISFFDMNLFLEKKTNLGLYNLKNYINFKIFVTGGDFVSSDMLINLLKLQY